MEIETYKIKFDDSFTNNIIDYFNNLELFSHFIVNLNSEKLSLLEKISYDIALFHLNKLNMTLENKKISFWIKSKRASCSKCLNLHTDGDDYERIIYNNTSIKPLFTTLTYFNNNDLTPTLITQITDEQRAKQNFINKDISLIFSKKNLHIFFDGKNKIHCETNFFNSDVNISTDRYILIVAVWDSYGPMNVPYYNDIQSKFAIFSKTDRQIIFNNFKKNTPFIKFDKRIKSITVESNNLTNSFFHHLLFNQDDNIFKDLSCEITKEMITSNDIINIKSNDNISCVNNKMQIKKTASSLSTINTLMKSMLQTYSITLSTGFEKYFHLLLDKCIESNINSSVRYLDNTLVNFNFIEKFIYENALNDLLFFNQKQNTNYKLEDIHVEYFFKSMTKYPTNNMRVNSNETKGLITMPFLTSFIELNDSINPTIITNVDIDSYKYKNFNNFNLFFSFPKRFKKLLFEGGKYFHTTEASIFEKHMYDSPNAIVINYWLKKTSSNLQVLSSVHKNTYEEDCIIYSKHDSLLNFIVNNTCLKVEIDDETINCTFFKNVLYNKPDLSVYKVFVKHFFDIEINENSNILLVSSTITNTKNSLKPSKLQAFDFFNNSTFIKQYNFNVTKIIPSFIDASGCNFIYNNFIKHQTNKELCHDISQFNCIENYLIEHTMFQNLISKMIMYYNIENSISINIEKITINDTSFIKNIKNTNNSIMGACLIYTNTKDNYIILENNNVFEVNVGDFIFFNSEVNLSDECFYLFFSLNCYN
jgi:hypothetical protein